MGRTSRTFKLRLSPAGMDLLLDAHCHLIRATRQLLAWGTTLHVAVVHLDVVPVERIGDDLRMIRQLGLCGGEVHFLGAPTRLQEVARRAAGRVRAVAPDEPPPALLHVYIVALRFLVRADADSLRACHERVQARPVRTPAPAKAKAALGSPRT